MGEVACLDFEGAGVAADQERALAACRQLRCTVFIEEQGVPAALEWDGLDPEARHFLAFERMPAGAAEASARSAALFEPSLDRALGTARMRRIEGHAKAERVAVRVESRRQGVGRLLMQALEARARSEGLDAIVLHAQLTAIQFYESLGYAAHGDVFLDAGIDHRAMTKSLH